MWSGIETTGVESQMPIQVAESRNQPVFTSGSCTEYCHVTLPGYSHGFEPCLNGELYALKGARMVRGGEAGK
jgi:hypothetical protein